MSTKAKSLAISSLGAILTATLSVGLANAAAPSIKVPSQKITGDEVTIADVKLPRDGFLVIQPSDAKGRPTEKSIGDVALKAGDHKEVKVKLTENHKPGDRLWAVLHNDTGTKGRYEFGTDGKTKVDAAMKVNGRPVERSFKVE